MNTEQETAGFVARTARIFGSLSYRDYFVILGIWLLLPIILLGPQIFGFERMGRLPLPSALVVLATLSLCQVPMSVWLRLSGSMSSDAARSFSLSGIFTSYFASVFVLRIFG